MLASALALLLLTACVPFHRALVEGQDYRIDQAQRIIFARGATQGQAMARVAQLCAQRGIHAGLHAAYDGATVQACYDGRDDVIILPEGSRPGDADWEHEMKHRLDGNWHQ